MLLRAIWTMIKIIKLSELNKIDCEDLTMSNDTNPTVGKIAIGLIRSAKRLEFPKGNCKVVCNRLLNKYALHTSLSLLKLKSKVHNSKFESKLLHS